MGWRTKPWPFLWLAVGALYSGSALSQNPEGAQIYRDTCSVCHDSGAGQAPRLQDQREWQMRARKGLVVLFQVAYVKIFIRI